MLLITSSFIIVIIIKAWFLPLNIALSIVSRLLPCSPFYFLVTVVVQLLLLFFLLVYCC